MKPTVKVLKIQRHRLLSGSPQSYSIKNENVSDYDDLE